MKRTKAIFIDAYYQSLLGLAYQTNEPAFAANVIDGLPFLSSVKAPRETLNTLMVEMHTESPQELVVRCRALISDPSVPGKRSSEPQRLRAASWYVGELSEEDCVVLKTVLLKASPTKYVRSSTRRKVWYEIRHQLVIDILTLCELVVNHHAIK